MPCARVRRLFDTAHDILRARWPCARDYAAARAYSEAHRFFADYADTFFSHRAFLRFLFHIHSRFCRIFIELPSTAISPRFAIGYIDDIHVDIIAVEAPQTSNQAPMIPHARDAAALSGYFVSA